MKPILRKAKWRYDIPAGPGWMHCGYMRRGASIRLFECLLQGYAGDLVADPVSAARLVVGMAELHQSLCGVARLHDGLFFSIFIFALISNSVGHF